MDMTIGSFNLDVVSIFGNMELNTEVYNLPIAQQTHEKLSEIANDSKKISYSSWKILSPVYFLITLFSYLFVRFTLQMLSDDEIGDLNI
jgi:phosphatidylserine/phosphatidylglycerophosphate/cardiolipin synthase-like enzyme